MKNSLTLVFFLSFYLLFFGLNAQTREIDSLENLLLKHTKKDTIRVNLLNKAAYKLYLIDIDKTFTFAKEAKEISEQVNYKKGIAESLNLFGIYHDEKSNFPEALKYYEEALTIHEELNNKVGITKCYNNIGIIYRYRGDYPKALEYYQKALKLNEELGNKSGMSYSLNNIGIIYYYLSDYPKALEYYKKSLKLDEELNDKNGISYSLNNIGIIYEYQNDYPKALEYYKKSLKIKEELADKGGMATACYNIGTIYKYQHEYTKAYEFYQKSSELSIKFGKKSTETYSYVGLASLYLVRDKPKEAYSYAKKAYELAKETGNAELIKESSEILAKSAESMGLYKDAYQYHVVFKTINDSLYNEKNTKKIIGLEYQYKSEKEKKVAELARQKKDALLKEKEKRQAIVRNSFIGGFILMTLFVLAILRNLSQKRKANRVLALQKEKIKSANEKLQALNATKDKFFSIISHDLKSPFNAILGFSGLLLKNYQKYDDKTRRELIKFLDDSAGSAFKLLEDLLTWSRSQLGGVEFSPKTIKLNDLISEIMNDMQGQATGKGINVVYEVSEDTKIFADKNMISAVLRNLISNSVKFTDEGGEIKINAVKREQDILLSVSDTGVGISEEKLSKLFKLSEKTSTVGTKKEKGTGLGLILCKEFVEKHGGKIWAESKENIGSVFSFSIPNK